MFGEEGNIEAFARFEKVIVAGETGSGKTTQCPNFILEAVVGGLGGNGSGAFVYAQGACHERTSFSLRYIYRYSTDILSSLCVCITCTTPGKCGCRCDSWVQGGPMQRMKADARRIWTNCDTSHCKIYSQRGSLN